MNDQISAIPHWGLSKAFLPHMVEICFSTWLAAGEYILHEF